MNVNTFLGQLAGGRLGSRAVEERHERHDLEHLGVLDGGRELAGESEVGEDGVRVHRVGSLVPVGDEDFSDLALRVWLGSTGFDVFNVSTLGMYIRCICHWPFPRPFLGQLYCTYFSL